MTTTVEPIGMCGWRPPAEPTRMKWVAPTRTSSSTAIDADGPPMPVEQTLIGVPASVTPV